MSWQLEGSGTVGNWSFQEVLERLLDLVTIPVKQALCQEKIVYSGELVQNCCHLLARVVAELASQSSGTDVSWQLFALCQLACISYSGM
jgi:E3 ubiquitin-protein ligase MYCBP2